MERIETGNDARLAWTEFAVRIFTRQLEGRLVGFRARVAKKGPIGKRRFGQRTCQAQHRLIGVAIADMPQGFRLCTQRFDDHRIGMPQAGDGNACGEIEITIALLIPHFQSGGAHRHQVARRIGWHHHVIEGLAGDVRLRCGTGFHFLNCIHDRAPWLSLIQDAQIIRSTVDDRLRQFRLQCTKACLQCDTLAVSRTAHALDAERLLDFRLQIVAIQRLDQRQCKVESENDISITKCS